MDIVYLSELKVETTIGVSDWERKTRQFVLIDLDMGTDSRAAGKSDNIADALDYRNVTKRIREEVESGQFHLIEALAEHLAHMLLTEFSLPWLRLKLTKPGAIRGTRYVGIIIERGNKSEV